MIYNIDIFSDKNEVINFALQIAVLHMYGKKEIVGYRIDEEQGLILYTSQEDDIVLFPSSLGIAEILPIIISWLNTATYPKEPDTDGSTKKGFHITSQLLHFGKPTYNYNVLLVIKPKWIIYGK